MLVRFVPDGKNRCFGHDARSDQDTMEDAEVTLVVGLRHHPLVDSEETYLRPVGLRVLLCDGMKKQFRGKAAGQCDVGFFFGHT